MSLRKKTKYAFVWSAVDLIGGKAFIVVSQLIMARILDPSDFGILAILMVFVSFSNVLIEGGMSQALVQKKATANIDYTTVFYYKIGLSILVYIIFWISTPYIALFYEQPELTKMGRVIAVVFVVNAFAGVHMAVLTKNLDFKSITIRNFISNVTSGVAGIVMAYIGFGVWSLIFMVVIQNVLNSALLWPLVRWRPKLEFSWNSLRSLFKYGSNLAISSILNTSFNEMNKVVIGKLFGVVELGFYRKSAELRDLVSSKINNVFVRILFPAFSFIQDDLQNLKKQVGNAIQAQSFISFPLLTFLIIYSDSIVSLILTDKWLPMVPFLQLLAIISYVSPINTNSKNTMKVLGRTDYYLWTEVIRKILYALNILISYRFGVIGLLVGLIIISYVGMFVNMYYSNKQSGFSYTQQLKDSFQFLLLSYVGILPSWLIVRELEIAIIAELVVAVSVYFISYISLSLLLKIEIAATFKREFLKGH